MAEIKLGEIKQRLFEQEKLYCAYCRHTRMPYVWEGEDYTDQVFVFESEDACKGFVMAKSLEMVPIVGTCFEKKDYNRLFTTILYTGADTILYQTLGDWYRLPMDGIARLGGQDQEEAKRPLVNPGLQLCTLYFLQEARRPEKWQNKEKLTAMGEEVLANLKRSEYLVTVSASQEDPSKIVVPYMKTKEGKIIQPLFSDLLELEKYAQGKQLKAHKIGFDKLKGLLIPDSIGFLLNPLGFAYPMEKKLLEKLSGAE